jgi:signal transduction histidine kinase
MGHELRTPLNAINGFSEIMAAESLGPIGTPAYRDYVQHIHDSGRHLLTLINQVLDVTRLQMNTLAPECEDIDIRSFVRNAAGQLGATAQQAQVAIITDNLSAARLMADPRLLRQLLFNLVGNAIKFAPPETTVEVVGADTQDGGYALTVRDEGPGIPEEARQRLMQAFQQGDDSLARRHEGLGLGLYIARGIAEAHGGRLEIGTAPSGSAAITAHFPARCREVPPADGVTAEAKDAATGV